MRTVLPIVMALAAGPLALAQSHEPRYEGKSLSEWVALMDRKPASHKAAIALGAMGPAAIPALVKAMRSHPDGAIRWLSHVSLAKIGRPALPELDKIMQDGDVGARIQAVLAFEKILGRDALPRLKQAIRDKGAQVRARAHGAMLRLDEPKGEHLPRMIEILRSDPSARWIAAEALGQCGPKAAGAEEALAEVLHSPGKSTADRALWALEQIGTDAAKRLVCEAMATRLRDPSKPTAARLAALVRLGKAGTNATPALPALRAIAADKDTDVLVRGYAAWAAEQIAPRPADEPGRTYHVAQKHPDANDANPGTPDQPWSTIRRAAEALRPGDTVLIHEGVYRELVRPFLGGTSYDRMVTYRGAPGAKPVLKASDPWQPKWRREGDRVWSAPYQRHTWDQPEKWPKPRHGAMHRAEQVFVDGKLLEHVDTPAELAAKPGRMLTDDEAGRLWVHLAGDGPPAASVVERSIRQQVFAPAVRGLGYVRVQGFTMLHGAAPECNGACWGRHGHRAVMSARAGHHWIIEDNTIAWGNAQGLDVGGEGFSADLRQQPIVSDEKGHHQVRRNDVSYHGVAGIVGWASRTNHLLLEDNVTNYNCQKGNLYQYESAGVKLHNAEDCVIRRHRAHGNHAFGIWLDYRCLRNRVTQCILTENMAAGFFFEVSAGPLLVDNNVILRTRDAARGNWAEGIYSHDGNYATYINNYIAACAGHGVRLRNLFARIAAGKPTTTSHNRIQNNFIFDCARGGVSLNPDVPRATDNHSDHNVFWAHGRPLRMRLDFGGTKLKWEQTAVGKALGQQGRGTLNVPLATWQDVLGEDANSLLLPPKLLFDGLTAEQTREQLQRLWPKSAPGLDEGYGEVTPQTARERVARLNRALAGAELARVVRLAPDAGVQVWGTADGPVGARWTGSDSAQIVRLTDGALLREPVPSEDPVPTLAAGDTVRLPAAAGERVLFAGLETTLEGDGLAVSAPADAMPGEYVIVSQMDAGWRQRRVRVEEAYRLISMEAKRDPEDVLVLMVENRRNVPVQGTLRLQVLDQSESVDLTFRPQTVQPIKWSSWPPHMKIHGAAPVTVSIDFPGSKLSETKVISFARAARSDHWQDAPVYPIDSFSGGSFPEGAEAFALFQGGFGAKWAARYDDQALHVRVLVNDEKHVQTQPRHTLWKQDSVQLLVKAEPTGKPLALDLTLPSAGGPPQVFRCQWPKSTRAPGPLPKALAYDVTRRGRATTYLMSIPWTVLGLDTAPARGTPIRLSLLVNNDDGSGRVGVQWFFGIHTHRGDADRMGTLWLE